MHTPWIRRTALGLGALLVLLVLAVAVLITTFDADHYKRLAIDWMMTERQRTLVIDGPIALSVFPRLAVKLSKLRLSEPNQADEFAALDELSLSIETLPLLRQQLVVDRVSVRGVRAVYRRDAQGARNIDDLIGASPAPGAAPPPGPAAAASTPLRFDVSAVVLDDVRLHLHDAMAPLQGELVLQSFKSGRLAHQAETPVSLRASLQLQQPQPLKITLDGSSTLVFDLDKQSMALSAMKLNTQIDGAGFKNLALGAEGTLAWDAGALRAQSLRLALKGGSRGELVLAPSSIKARQLLFNPAAKRLELEALQVTLAGQLGADRPFECSLDWPQLTVDAQSLSGSALSGQLKLSGPAALTGKFQSGAPSGRFDALRLPGVLLTLQGQMQQRKVDGTLKAELLLDASRGALVIEALDLRASLSDPGLQPLQLAVRGSAEASAAAAHWTLAGALNTNQFKGTGQAALGGPVPDIKASAHFDSLDLNKLLAPATPTGASAAAGPAPADTRVALDSLTTLNGQFNISAGRFVFRQYRVSDLRLAAVLDGGTLRINPLAGRAWGGGIEASGTAEASRRRITVTLLANGVDVNALLKDVTGKDLLEGSGRVTANLNTRGETLGEMRSQLAGTAGLQLRNGAVKGVNLARSMRQAKAALSMKQDAVSKAGSTEKTDFSELSATARIVDGVATSDDLDEKSPFLRIGGAGRFDIGRGQIDYTARATVIGSPAGQDGAELQALRGLTVPVHLSGPFDAISWKIQWSGVAAAALEKTLKDKLTESLGGKLGLGGTAAPAAGAASAPQKPKDKLRDMLKGLLR